MKKGNKSRRTFLSSLVAVSGVGGLSAIGSASRKAPAFDPDDHEAVGQFGKHFLALTEEKQRQLIGRLSDAQRNALLEGLKNVEIVAATTVVPELHSAEPIPESGDTLDSSSMEVSPTAFRCWEVQNVVLCHSSVYYDWILWQYYHNVSWCADSSGILSGDWTTSGSANVYTWRYVGDVGGSEYQSSDGYNSRREGHFRYCGEGFGTTLCIDQNDLKGVSVISAFPSGEHSEWGEVYEM